MNLQHRLLIVSFIESFATILLERGVYFYTHERMAFTESQNLWLALVFGITYVIGAIICHPLSTKTRERPLLLAAVTGQLLMHAALAIITLKSTVMICFSLLGLLNGLKWPIVESYISAGRSPRLTLRAVGQFNIAWAAAVPLAVAASGPMIASPMPNLLFYCAAIINLAAIMMLRDIPLSPEHLPHDHPNRPSQISIKRYRRLLASSRWSMLGSYTMLFLLAPLMPKLFQNLGLTLSQSTWAASLLDVIRVAAFAAFATFTFWYGRKAPLALITISMPAGFFMILFGRNLITVLTGELLFGAAAGLCYFAALYYALVVKNAAVHAGAIHEGLIGTGFALGPAIGLLGHALAITTGNITTGMIISITPFILLSTTGAILPIFPANQKSNN